MSIPVALPPGRAGVQPSLAFSYLSTAGNGIMGIGWIVSIPFIARQTDKGLARYAEGSLSGWQSGSLDRFIYNGGEEIVPVATPEETADCRMNLGFQVSYYDPATGAISDEAVEKFPDEVCGWWYFRTNLEGAFLKIQHGVKHKGSLKIYDSRWWRKGSRLRQDEWAPNLLIFLGFSDILITFTSNRVMAFFALFLSPFGRQNDDCGYIY